MNHDRPGHGRGAGGRRGRRRPLPAFDRLESRRLPSSGVLTYHNDLASTGQDPNETVLTRGNVNSTTFGKLFPYPVDGQIYAQPLVEPGVKITAGPNAGVHDVVFVATEHDSVYAIDAGNPGGQLLWQRSLLDTGLANSTSITPVPSGATGSNDITIEVGITGTPVISPSSNLDGTAGGTLYVIAKTADVVGGVTHYVQWLHAINVADGTDRVAPLMIGDTTGSNTNNTPIFVYGKGNGSVTDPYHGTGQLVVQFNALHEHQRPALTLLNGVVYAAWASHGDNGPYHGWVVGFDATTLAPRAVLNTTPNGTQGGIWQSGGALSSDGTNLFLESGNGTFDGGNGSDTVNNPPEPAPGPVTGLNAAGFPAQGDYGDSFLKLTPDAATSETNQNINGWGLKVADYFTPFNQQYLTGHDLDLGSGAPLILPDSVGGGAHPHLLVGAGKEGKLYLIDRDNMGKYGVGNGVVQEIGGALSGSLDTAAYLNGTIYYVEGYGGTAKTFAIAGGAISPTTPTSRSTDSFSFAGSTPSISSNAGLNGIVWDIDRGTNQLRAYSTDSYATELYTSAQAAGGRDSLGAAVKFQVATVANGHVYVGSGTGNPNNVLLVYGLIQPPNAAPNAPTGLTATTVSGTQINLNWTDHDVSPNTASSYAIEESPDGQNGWTQVATANAGATSYSVGGLATATTYYFRVHAVNSIGASAPTNVAGATTASQVGTIDFSNGFAAGTAGVLTLNGAGSAGGAYVSGSRLRLTDGGSNERRSAFTTGAVDITKFTTTFTFQISAGGSTGDGFTFTIQGVGNTALGPGGGGLGYGPDKPGGVLGIAKSLAIKFDLSSNAGEGANSTGIYTNGASPTAPFVDLTGKIDLHSGDVMSVTLSYDGTNVTESITDTVTKQAFSTTYTGYNLPGLVGSGSGYVGFTAATGAVTATQDILTWSYSPPASTPPGIPQNVQAVVTGYTASSTTAVPLGATLTWNDVPGASGFKVERSAVDDQHFAQVGTTGAGVTTFKDTGLATQTTYYYRVRATNAFGDGAYSAEVSVGTPALAPTPTNGRVTAVTPTSIGLSWTDNASNEDGYKIFRNVNGGTFSLLVVLPPDTNPAPSTDTYTDTTVAPGTAYDYHIQAFNLAGYSDFVGLLSTTPDLPPSGLTAVGGNGQVALSWTAPSGTVTGYNVYRGSSPGGEGATPIATGLASPSFTDTGLANGTTYYYQVTAVDAAGESARSAEASAAPQAPQVPAAPANVAATAGDQQVTLSWSASAGATSYNVYRGTSPGGEGATPVATGLTNLSYSNTGLANGTTYYYQVTAVSAAGESARSAEASATPQPLAAPNLTATAGNGQVTLSWSASTGAASYNVYRGTSPGGEGATPVATGVAGTTLTDSGLTNGTTYYYQVSPVDSVGEGPRSAERSATPTAAAAVHINFSNNTTQVPTGYINDTGLAYGPRGGGLTFGWNASNTAAARDRESALSPDERYDSLIHMQLASDPNASWSIALPNGLYSVHVIAGDPTAYNSVYKLNVQGVPVINGTPTAKKLWFENTVTVAVNNGLLTVTNAPGSVNNKIDAIDIVQVNPGQVTGGLNFSGGFAGAVSSLTLNGAAVVNAGRLRLTDGGLNEASSTFSTNRVDVSAFTTQFSFQLTNPNSDGFTFLLQGVGPTALGANGGGLGYGPDHPGGTGASIANSVAVKFDLANNAGEGIDSTGLYLNGASPTVPATDLTPSGVNLHSGDVFNVSMSYDGTTLTVTITDATTSQTATQSYAVNIPAAVGGNVAYAGFTAATGATTATQEILSWTYSPTPLPAAPAAPVGLAATAGVGQVTLTWTAPAGAVGYNVYRGTTPGGEGAVAVATVYGQTSYTDPGLGNATYYYQVSAIDAAGEGARSAEVSVKVGVAAPPAPTNLVATAGNGQVVLSWTAATGATSYNVYRGTAAGGEAATPVATGIAVTSFTDTGLTNGTTYYYKVTAVNSGGEGAKSAEAFAKPTAPQTAPAAPTNVAAIAGNGQVALSWTAPAGATSYNIYRGTAAGGEAATPVATGIAVTSFTDTGLTNGTTYYYKVSAVNAVGEGAMSAEVGATPTAQAGAISFTNGFATGTAGVLTFNGGSVVSGSRLRLTDGGKSERRSVFTTSPVTVSSFSTTFTFQISAGSSIADGFTFTVQGVGNTALGPGGGGLGYGPGNPGGTPGIAKSLAIKFDTASNAGEGANSTGIYTNGASPTAPFVDLTGKIDLHSGDVMSVTLSYDGTNVTESITDTVTKQAFSTTYTGYNLTTLVGGSTAYVGFTAGTGALTSTQDILTWTYTPGGAPATHLAAATRSAATTSTSFVPIGGLVTSGSASAPATPMVIVIPDAMVAEIAAIGSGGNQGVKGQRPRPLQP